MDELVVAGTVNVGYRYVTVINGDVPFLDLPSGVVKDYGGGVDVDVGIDFVIDVAAKQR